MDGLWICLVGAGFLGWGLLGGLGLGVLVGFFLVGKVVTFDVHYVGFGGVSDGVV